MAKIMGFIVALIFIGGVTLLILWAGWSLWCWVLPQVWATGPSQIVQPGYWLFAACWTLISLLGKAVFGRSKE